MYNPSQSSCFPSHRHSHLSLRIPQMFPITSHHSAATDTAIASTKITLNTLSPPRCSWLDNRLNRGGGRDEVDGRGVLRDVHGCWGLRRGWLRNRVAGVKEPLQDVIDRVEVCTFGICRYGLNECWGARKEKVERLNIRLENRFGEQVAVALGCATTLKAPPHIWNKRKPRIHFSSVVTILSTRNVNNSNRSN